MTCEVGQISKGLRAGSGPSIAVVTYYFHPLYGGMETHLLLLSRFLAATGSTITVFTSLPHGTEADEYLFGVRVRRYGSAATLQGLERAYTHIFGDLKRSLDAFDILYMPLGVGPKYPLSLQLEVVQLFLSCRKSVVLRITSSGRVKELLRLAPTSVSILRQVSQIVSLNAGISSELRVAGVREEALFCVPNGVDVNLFKPVYRDDNLSLEKNYPCRFVYPCRICKKKSVDALIEDWKKAREIENGLKNAELCVIGDDNCGTEDRSLYEQIKKLAGSPSANVKLVPAATYWQMPDFYRMGDIFVCYSLKEGMSNAALEAMASGLPIIAPDTDAFRPLLHDSPNFVYENRSKRLDALLEAARKRTDWNRIGLFNRDRVVEMFSTDVVFPKYLHMFESLAAVQNKNQVAMHSMLEARGRSWS